MTEQRCPICEAWCCPVPGCECCDCENEEAARHWVTGEEAGATLIDRIDNGFFRQRWSPRDDD